jgi:hypothetical protein
MNLDAVRKAQTEAFRLARHEQAYRVQSQNNRLSRKQKIQARRAQAFVAHNAAQERRREREKSSPPHGSTPSVSSPPSPDNNFGLMNDEDMLNYLREQGYPIPVGDTRAKVLKDHSGGVFVPLPKRARNMVKRLQAWTKEWGIDVDLLDALFAGRGAPRVQAMFHKVIFGARLLGFGRKH